jgi:hypothetical protein
MTLEQFRREQDSITRMLQERALPGTKITLLDVTGDDGAKLPSMFVVRRLTEFPNGAKEYRVSSTMLAARYAATLISTARDEETATRNHSVFAMGVLLFISTPRP